MIHITQKKFNQTKQHLCALNILDWNTNRTGKKQLHCRQWARKICVVLEGNMQQFNYTLLETRFREELIGNYF